MNIFRLMAPAPRRPPVKEPTKGSTDDQFLAEYLIARRTNQRVDKEWEKVHQHRRGKKRFKNIVCRTMFIERIRAMGLEGDEKVGVTDVAGSVGVMGGAPKKTVTKKERTMTQEQREQIEQRLKEIDQENEKKKGMRERYIMENAGSRTNSGTSVRKLNGKRKLRKFAKNSKKMNKTSEFDEICNFDTTPNELIEEDNISEPENDCFADTGDIETYEIYEEEKIIPQNNNRLDSKTKDDQGKGRIVPRAPLLGRGTVIRENSFFNEGIKEKENKLSVKDSLGVLKSPNLHRSPRVSPINSFPRGQILTGVAGARGGVMPKLKPAKKRVPSKGVTTTVKGAKKGIKKPQTRKKEDQKGHPREEKAPKVYVVPAIRM